MQPVTHLFSYPRYWAECYGTAPFLPMSRAEMDKLGWDSCDIVLVTGDAYVDHPSFGMAVIGRMLESQGFRVGIIAQPDWSSKDDFMRLGKPNLFYGVTAGNMDSMINRYTSDKKLRHDDAYTPGDIGGKRPDRATLVYTQRCKEAFKEVPVVIGGIEASLRRIAHYDYWSETIRRSILLDAKADILIYGNAERPLIEVAHRIANGETIDTMQDIRGTAVIRKEPLPEWRGVDSSKLDQIGRIDPIMNPYMEGAPCSDDEGTAPVEQEAKPVLVQPPKQKPWEKTYVKLPAFERVKEDKVLYAHASRILHHETNPGCARALSQAHGDRIIWVNPPAFPLETDEMDGVFGLPYQRVPHPAYGKEKIPAYEMIKTSVNIMRGCFGGCSFCSITEHEGRIIQSRSEESIIKEIEEIRDKVPGFTGVISDLGGPTTNMYKLRCKSPRAEQTCRRASCVWPTICPHMDTDHTPTINLYRKARDVKGIKKILIASGVRYDIAVEDPRYIKELAKYHVGGYLKIAPEHTEEGPLSKMMKPGMGSYYSFKELFDKYSKEAGKQQYLIPYFISAHPGTTDEDMVNMALWVKTNNFKLDQVQNFYPSPLANATTMYYTEKNPLNKVSRQGGDVFVVKGERRRRLHKALLRYHDPAGWPMIREALLEMGKGHLIGNGPNCLVPPEGRGEAVASRSINKGLKPALTRHSNIVHQRGNGAGKGASAGKGAVAAASQGKARNDTPAASKSGKAGNGKPVGSQLSKGAGANGKPAAQGAGQSKPAGQGKPVHKGKTPTRAGSAKPATQGGKPAAKGNGAKRPAR
ncbi:TPA: YgiQ family radical SAM protein [Aeromonas salmonicida]|uniref:YgiQ family radical SAM protein n=1 Tax=Aeromonas salmonicida TaxID=645 RepID=UPI000B597EA9|nr:YgiQ family radical SAM protein [Aeromonas salmonicida]ELI6441891.1 YgiQ family radical SAM protein [Aeromonas salmonicida subsp. salmonicida]ASI22791.1 YgiQ family radical SAM protein [Aeromonas salmonicida]ASI27106.1 YgiQ family radical SAM protein [Aeromonas salmonicida]ASI31224.1 YgiQ family radical SAM protein [Aeromonas salmonicida]ATD39723.1 YgiQ family radical SAM protein [Aeromonas salmonicida subsp. masoucida]